ncbi:hypothetical protein [Natrarchaeobaculum sulfurireducens]|uniref:STAS/SEC14 domain-containing protein n=1 Tax=Natrarchaeobaculum sulfurireducens TaxID=2044521 RepID=A0A346PJL3_9EURY|nr:hypothetical protein [Natrarchaeobaculum sulfurireducens]AXR79708.1 hypothetical protein AArc1_3415 [Natrarchaeobaculum sulfurireducens]
MTANTLPKPSEYEWDFEQRGGVGIWFMSGWQGFADEDLEAASDHYRERGKRSDIDATLAVFGDETKLPKETQEFMGEAWSENGEYTGVERIGFVAEGITAMAVKSNVDVDGAEVESFTDLETALEWARA